MTSSPRRLSIVLGLAAALASAARGEEGGEARGAGSLPWDDPHPATRTAITSALNRLDRALSAHLGRSGSLGGVTRDLVPRSRTAPLVVVYEGVWEMEAHLKRPYDAVKMRTRLEFSDAGEGGRRLDWTTYGGESDSAGSTETIVVGPDHVVQRGDQGDPFLSYTLDQAPTLRFLSGAGIPWVFCDEVREHAAGARWLGTMNPPAGAESAPLGGAKVGAVESDHVAGRSGDLFIGDPEPAIRAVQIPWAHPRLGDVLDWATYDHITTRSGVTVAESLTVRWHQDTSASMLRLTLRSVSAPAQISDRFTLLADVFPSAPARDDDTPHPVLKELAPRAFTIELAEQDMRSLVVEFEDHLVVCEAPLSSRIGEAMVDLLAERFPEKPVRYVLFSHYHPHYTGALRAFMAAGATIVAAPGCASFVRDIARRTFVIAPDRLALRARAGGAARMGEPKIETFEGHRTFEDAAQALEAWNIGAQSNHTDDYVVFYLPAAGILFEGDLGWFSANGETRAGRRAAGLLAALDAAAVHPARFLQAWPVKDVAAVLTADELRALIAAQK